MINSEKRVINAMVKEIMRKLLDYLSMYCSLKNLKLILSLKASSCFKWLEFKEPEKKKENEGKGEGEEEKKEEDPFAELKPINKALVSIITDDNIELHDGEEITDSCEKDMRQSMLLNIYLGLACCYMNLYHYSTALRAIEEGFKISPSSSQLYFRRSQVYFLTLNH